MKKLSQIFIIVALVLFTGAAQARWSALGTGIDGTVWEVASDTNGNIYVGGEFTAAGGISGTGNIAKWNTATSTWSALGAGLNGPVYSIVSDSGGNIYVGGQFKAAGGISNADYIAKWNGSEWSAVGKGLPADFIGFVNVLKFDSVGNLYAGGSWCSATTGGDFNYSNIAKWDGKTWNKLGTGMDGPVFALAFDSTDNLYIGGRFTTVGGVAARKIAKWNGTTWNALGTGWRILGTTMDKDDEIVSIAIDKSGNLYAGGEFVEDVGWYVNANYMSRWNGSTWEAFGAVEDGRIYKLGFDKNSNLYVVGGYTTIGGISANGIARWNGSNWIALGTGMDSPVVSFAFDNSGNLYAGGLFTTAGGTGANNIAKWTFSDPGDMNGNGVIDLADAILALRVLAGIPVTDTINLNADVNSDKKIGIEEVIYILQKVSGVRGNIQITGLVLDNEKQQPVSGIKIRVPSTADTKETFSGDDGRYILSVSENQIPDSFLILASDAQYVPDVRNITKISDKYEYVADFSMKKISPDTVILEIEPALHHLGNDFYSGAINSQFQAKEEGITYTKTFEVTDFHLSFSNADIVLVAKGLELDNTIYINGNQIGYLNSSPSDGSFVTLSWASATGILSKGSNVLKITSGQFSENTDYDDFEFTNIIIRFRN